MVFIVKSGIQNIVVSLMIYDEFSLNDMEWKIFLIFMIVLDKICLQSTTFVFSMTLKCHLCLPISENNSISDCNYIYLFFYNN